MSLLAQLLKPWVLKYLCKYWQIFNLELAQGFINDWNKVWQTFFKYKHVLNYVPRDILVCIECQSILCLPNLLCSLSRNTSILFVFITKLRFHDPNCIYHFSFVLFLLLLLFRENRRHELERKVRGRGGLFRGEPFASFQKVYKGHERMTFGLQ